MEQRIFYVFLARNTPDVHQVFIPNVIPIFNIMQVDQGLQKYAMNSILNHVLNSFCCMILCAAGEGPIN